MGCKNLGWHLGFGASGRSFLKVSVPFLSGAAIFKRLFSPSQLKGFRVCILLSFEMEGVRPGLRNYVLQASLRLCPSTSPGKGLN